MNSVCVNRLKFFSKKISLIDLSNVNKRNFFIKTDYKKIYKKEKIVNFTKEELFNVVLKTDEYFKFLPGCHKSVTKFKKDNKSYVELEVGFPPLLETYVSEVTFNKPNHVIAKSKNGKLFNNLISKWEFHDLILENSDKKKCLVKFEIEFDFKSKFLMQLGMPFFEITAKNTLDAFLKRAKETYSSK